MSAATPAGDDRDLEELGEAGQLGRRPGAQDARTGQDHRAARRGQEFDDGAELLVGRARDGRPDRIEPGIVGHRLIEQVLGQRQEDRAGPAAEGLADRLGHRAGDRRRPRRARRPTWRGRRGSPPGRSPGTPRGHGTGARPGRRSRTSGSKSCRAVWIPMARLAAPTARVPRHTAGRPVSCPWASAMNAAAPSWRVATTRMPAPSNASSRPRKDSPGTVKAYRTPADRRASATNRPTVRGPASTTGSRSAEPPRRGSGASVGASTGSRSSRAVGRHGFVGRRLGRRRSPTARPLGTSAVSPAPPRLAGRVDGVSAGSGSSGGSAPRVRMRVRRRRPRWSARPRVRRRARS